MSSIQITLISLFLFASCQKKDAGDDPGNPVNPPGPIIRYQNFYVDGNNLKDSSGNKFVMRGNNFPVFWFPTTYKPSLSAAASLYCNVARLVWQLRVESWTPSLAVLDEALAECIRLKMVPIVELHDFTGGMNATDIVNATAYYTRADVKAVLDKYSHVLILNIANEWGDNSIPDLAWKNAYLPAITSLRNAGYKVPIMIDAPGWGQRETAIGTFGQDILNSDPLKNIIFSTHAYSNWNNSGSYETRINALLNKNLCLVFGEFGWDVPAAQQPAGFECRVDAPLLMRLCQQKGIGYLGWSWFGNNSDNACFDMCKSWSDTSQLTQWGRQWAYDINGVKNTAVKASVY